MSCPNLQNVRQYIQQIMPEIERPPTGWIAHPWLSVTCGEHYASTIFTWDFHHAAMRFAIGGNPRYLRHLVDNMLTHQAGDGLTPNVVQIERGPRFGTDSPLHAQPFLFQAALMHVHMTGDTQWGTSVFDKLANYLAYYDKAYSTAYGLLRWRTGWAGGIDNDVTHAFVPPDTIANADINAWVYIELIAAERFARRLGRINEADAYARRAATLRAVVNEKLWHPDEQTYCAYSLCDGEPMLRLKFDDVPGEVGRYAFQSCSNLIPLYARMADDDMARAMIEKYVINDAHFWSDYGIRSLSRASEYYNNAVFGNPSRFGDHRRMTESNWQGPVWAPVCYFTFQALRHYGFVDKATELADRIVNTLAHSLDVQGSFCENFHAETGEPLYAPNLASWNLLADTMHDDLANGTWIMDPIFCDEHTH